MTSATHRLTRIIAAAFAMGLLGGVAFAQSNRPAEETNDLNRSSNGIALNYVATEADTNEQGTLPWNVDVPALYRPLLESMLRRSATFRRQCIRIANEPRLSVLLKASPASPSAALRAVTRMVRKPNDRLWAEVEFSAARDGVELIAHEFEHIIEQLDGIDLQEKAAVAGSGVHAVDHERLVFETTRAKKVGLRVAQEVRTDPRRAD